MEVAIPRLTDKKNCSMCMICVNTCPLGAIEYDGIEFKVDVEKCCQRDMCTICVEGCKNGVLKLEYIETEKC